MPCFLALLTIAFPRIAILALYFLTDFFTRAYQSILILLLGFLFLPLTTIVYAWIVNAGQAVAGVYLVAIVVAVVLDLGLVGGGEYHRRRY
jgi:uncharacterized oligopeptide transporter (OPT) family protein